MSDSAAARGGHVVWRPDEATRRQANLTAFMSAHGIADYDALDRRSVDQPEWFWNAIISWFGLRFGTPYEAVLDSSAGAPWTRWCVGGTTNIVANCLDRHRGTPTMDRSALEWEGEDGTRRVLTYTELDAEVCRLAGALRRRGARAVLTADGTHRRGKPVALKSVIDEAAAAVPTLERVIVLRHVGLDAPMSTPRDLWWHEALAGLPATAPTQEVPADDPLILIFTSGTTGKAKGAVLTHCGFATKLALDLGLCMDFKASDRLLWMSDMGWLVGPIIVAGPTLLGGTVVMAEGAPDYPERGRLWRLVQDFRVSFLGIAPTVARALMQYGDAEVARYDRSSLRIIASTGEPWNPDSWLWVFDTVGGARVPIINYSGGTEIGGGILTGTVLHPLKPCSFAGSCPGMGADVVDASGAPVPRGEVGELVMRVPSIGLTRGLWKEPERYLESYWKVIPGMWVHGDFASVDADGFWYVHGRSDDTIKVAGKRVGPAEIESVLLATGKVAEAAVVGLTDAVKGQAVVCVCVARDAGPALADELSEAVARTLGPPFRPRSIMFVAELPKTRNMKIMRRVVRSVLEGRDAGDLSALVNPDAVTELRRLGIG